MDTNFGGKASEFQTAKVTLKVILKVTGNGAIRQATYDFMLVFHCNYMSLSNTSFSRIIYHACISTPLYINEHTTFEMLIASPIIKIMTEGQNLF